MRNDKKGLAVSGDVKPEKKPSNPLDLATRALALPGVRALRAALAAEGIGEAWLVGGVLRDLALDTPTPPLDLDVALPRGSEGVAQRLAASPGATAFLLDPERGGWRVVLADGGTVDLVPLRAPEIGGDLRGRDFTVNSLALDLLGTRGLLDPTGGLDDLGRRQLRACSTRALVEDPVRILRAYRFAVSLGLRMAQELPGQLTLAAPGLTGAAPERVRTEFFSVLGLPGGGGVLRTMAEHGVLDRLFPFITSWRGFDQGDYHAHDLLEHSLRVAAAADDLAQRPRTLPGPGALREHLDERLEAGITRRALLVCCAFLHDVAKPDTVTLDGSRRRFLGHEVRGGKNVSAILAGLRVGRRVCRVAARIVTAHLRVFQLAQQDPPTRRARLRYLQDLANEVPEAVILSLADELGTGPEPPSLRDVERTAAEVLGLHWHRKTHRPVEPLLRGRDLRGRLGLAEGPGIGEILDAVARAETLGHITDRNGALDLARRLAEDLELLPRGTA